MTTLEKIYSFFPFSDNPDKTMESLIVDAIETGIGYWCNFWPKVKGPTEFYSVNVWEALKEGRTLNFGEGEWDGQRGKINLNRILKAINIMMRDYPRTYADIREENFDCSNADIFFQLAVFGEVIFG